MLGLRGCRLLLVYPEILEMQIRAILGAAADVAARGISAKPEIMMPLVGTMGELERLRDQVMSVVRAAFRPECPRQSRSTLVRGDRIEFYGTKENTFNQLGVLRDRVDVGFRADPCRL